MECNTIDKKEMLIAELVEALNSALANDLEWWKKADTVLAKAKEINPSNPSWLPYEC